MQVLRRKHDAIADKTHVEVETDEFTDWYWVSGELSSKDALEILSPVIVTRLEEFYAHLVDTPHEIETTATYGLL